MPPDERNPWYKLLLKVLASWKEESGDSALPVSIAIERLFEELTEMRRDHRVGDGIFLSTIHGVKGMEFPHVFILDGNWVKARTPREMEEERRIVYVGMTRARETLTLFRFFEKPNPHLSGFAGDFAIVRRPETGETIPVDLLTVRYDALGMRDIVMGYAGRFPQDHSIHDRLGRLEPGSPLFLKSGGKDLLLCDPEGRPIGALSRRGHEFWAPRLHQVKSCSLLGMVRRARADEQDDFRAAILSDSWEIPWPEVVFVTG